MVKLKCFFLFGERLMHMLTWSIKCYVVFFVIDATVYFMQCTHEQVICVCESL